MIEATFTGKYFSCPGGEFPIVMVNCNEPEFKNVGFNVFVSEFKEMEISGMKIEDSEANYNCTKQWAGWIKAAFNNGVCGVYVNAKDYDSDKKEYKNKIFSVEG